METLYYAIANVFPAKARAKIRSLLDYNGSHISEDVWLGRALFVSAFVIAFSSILFFFIIENFIESLLALLFATLVFQLVAVLVLYYKAESRGKAVEKVLPNFLMLIAANLNSGMTPFQAFRSASRPEFGVLKEEADQVVALTISGSPFAEALLGIPGRIRSQTTKNVIELFIDGMKSGAPLSTLLSDIADDIIENLDLAREIVTRSKSYILFIAFIVVVGGPLLSSVSIHFVRTITDITSQVIEDMPEIVNVGGVTFGQLELSPDFLFTITVINLAITALIASWLIAVISKGDDRYFLKYFVVLLPACEIIFLVLDYIVGFAI